MTPAHGALLPTPQHKEHEEAHGTVCADTLEPASKTQNHIVQYIIHNLRGLSCSACQVRCVAKYETVYNIRLLCREMYTF